MEKIENNSEILDRGILEVFCFDSVGVKDKMTFDSCVVNGIEVTFWMDDDEDIEERINKMFDIFFEEVEKDIKSERKVVDY